MSSGSHETGSRAKKVTASDSAKPGPQIHIFFLSQGPLLAQIWYGDFYIWGIDAIKFLWRLGEGVGGYGQTSLGFKLKKTFGKQSLAKKFFSQKI